MSPSSFPDQSLQESLTAQGTLAWAQHAPSPPGPSRLTCGNSLADTIPAEASGSSTVDLTRYWTVVDHLDAVKINGRVAQVIGLVIESIGPPAMVGEICHIHFDRRKPPIP